MEASFNTKESMIVVAGAGTGKTWRLVRRYIRLIAGPDAVDMQKIACVTFTRAAATEMRERLLMAMATPLSEVKEDDVVLREALENPNAPRGSAFQSALAAAPIGTFHQLCAMLLREYGELVGVVPSFEILEPAVDQAEANAWLANEVDRLLDSKDTADEPDRRALVELLKEAPIGPVRDILGGIMASQTALLLGGKETAYPSAVRRRIIETILPANFVNDVWEAVEEFREGDFKLGRADARKNMGKLKAISPPYSCAAELVGQTGWTVKNLGADPPAFLNRLFTLKSEVAQIPPRRLNKLHEQCIEDALTGTHGSRLDRFWVLGTRLARRFRDQQAERGRLCYDELERLALALLEHERAGDMLRGRFEHILVDEFQDTNPVQVQVLDQLRTHCGKVVRYYVGDPKQSIYRFRDADVHTFNSQMHGDSGLTLVELPKSRRFSPDLAKALQAFFRRILGKKPAEGSGFVGDKAFAFLDNDETDVVLGTRKPGEQDEPLEIVTTRDENALNGKPIHLLLVNSKEYKPDAASSEQGRDEYDDESGTEDAESGKTNVGLQAKDVAGYIAHSLSTEKKIDGKPMKPSDFAILLPKWKDASYFLQALRDRGVPADVAGGRGLLGDLACMEVAALLRYLADPSSNEAALHVLRGPVCGLTDLGLYVLTRWGGVMLPDGSTAGDEAQAWPLQRARSLSACLRNQYRIDAKKATDCLIDNGVLDADRREATIKQLELDNIRLQAGARALEDMRKRIGFEPTVGILRQAVLDLGLEAMWMQRSDDGRSVANVWKLLALLEGIEGSQPAIEPLLQWIDGDSDPTPQGSLSSGQDVVTISTIHSAKGLEWPVVIMATLEAMPGSSTARLKEATIRFGKSESANLVYATLSAKGFGHDKDPMSDKGLVKYMTEADEVSELKRLLYVGMTRARDRVVLAGSVGPYVMNYNMYDSLDRDTVKQVVKAKDLQPTTRKDKNIQMLLPLNLRAPLIYCSQITHYVSAALSLTPVEPTSPAALRIDLTDGNGEQQSPVMQTGEDTLIEFCHVAGDEESMAANWTSPSEQTDTVSESELQARLAWKPTGHVIRLNPSKAPASAGGAPRTLLPMGKAIPGDIGMPETTDNDHDKRAAIGSMFHALAEHWNFEGDPPGRDVCERIACLYDARKCASEHAEWMGRAVAKLAQSPLYEAVREASARGRLWHELNLDCMLAAGQERVVGRIDMLYQDASDAWHLVDYKVTHKDTPSTKYAHQLALYTRALKEAHGIELASASLYLVPTGQLWRLNEG